jgi:hypothetical protein
MGRKLHKILVLETFKSLLFLSIPRYSEFLTFERDGINCNSTSVSRYSLLKWLPGSSTRECMKKDFGVGRSPPCYRVHMLDCK